MRPSSDAPQADRLDLVRRVVDVVNKGCSSTGTVAGAAQIASRQALYCLHAARQLDFVEASSDSEGWRVCSLGQRLLAITRGSAQEREFFRTAIRRSPTLGGLAPVVLADDSPSREQIAEVLMQTQGLALSTALRRARTLLAWRRYVLPQSHGAQLTLMFDGADWNEDAGDSENVDVPADLDTAEQLGVGETVSSEAAAANCPMPPALPLPDEIAPPTRSADDAVVVSPAAPPEDPTDALVADELIRTSDVAYLKRQMEQGAVVLLTGAGFSLGARDHAGRRLPTGLEYARELWEFCYPGDEFDSSSLQDIFEHAQRRHGNALKGSLASRFSVDQSSLPDWYAQWFSFPWARIYTLNVDDLERAVERRFDLPRSLRRISALTSLDAGSGESLDVVHLNGNAEDGPNKVTFSGDQYAQRIARQEPHYARLAAEILTSPFIFVGSPIDEPLLWTHIGLRGQRSTDSENEQRAKSFLVSPDLPKARVDKLRAYNVVWIKATAETFARNVLSQVGESAERGRARIVARRAADVADERNIFEVTLAAPAPPKRRTEFLMGEEPTWFDIASGRAVVRDEDEPFLARLRTAALAPPTGKLLPPIIAVSATAGAGKTTLLMRTALSLVGAGHRVAWVGSAADVPPAALTRYYRGADRPAVLIIDDAGRYNRELVPTLLALAKTDGIAMIVLALRSYHNAAIDTAAADVLNIDRRTIGPLTDGDIDRLLEALDREKRLGILLGLPVPERRKIFRDRAARQILVAMIEATSGEKFEDRIVREWQGQEAVARYVYALVSLATKHAYALTRDEILLSCAGKTAELDAIARLVKAHLISTDESGRYSTRHRVIAEKLVDELAQRGTQLQNLVIGLCRALAMKIESSDRDSRRGRVLRRLMNHDGLLRLLDDVESARTVYAGVEEFLGNDYHFWLQRGCLELEAGDVRFAETFLHQASALNPSDPLVETALAHMFLRKANLNPSAPDAGRLAEDAFETLRRLIAARGSKDHYPAHVFGSQALGWCRRAALTPRLRRALLREAREVIEQALTNHRGRSELRQLEHDLRGEELKPR